MKRLMIAVVGDARLRSDDDTHRIAEDLGCAIVDAGHRLVTGGRGGAMAAACLGARRSTAWRDGDIIAILPGNDPALANANVDIVIPTGLGAARNAIVAQADVVIGVGGGAGTLSELAMAWKFDRLVIGMRAGGWAERLAGAPVDSRIRYPNIHDDRVFAAVDADEALRIVSERAHLYVNKHAGIG